MNDSAHHDHTTAGQPDDSAELLGPALARLRQADPERWQAPIKPLLGVLLAARAPLDLDALGDILEVDSAALVAALDDLDGIVVNDQAAGYRLARLQPAPDQPGPPPPAFVLAPDDLRAGHRRLAAWCAEAEIWRDSADPAGHNLASQIKGYPEGTWVLLARCGRLREAVDSLELASLENDVLKVFSEWCGLAGWATETSPAAAAPFLERARLLSSTIEDPYRALYLVDVAGGYRAAGQPELGERLLDEALALAHAHQHESRTAHQLSGIARELAERGRIAAALDTAAAIPDLGERAKICCELAALIDQRGDGQAAAALLEMALLAAPSIDGTWKGAEAWGAIAGYWAGAGDFARAQAAAASIKDPKSQAAALLALARTSDAQTALSMLDQALTLASGIDDDEIRIPLRLGIAAQLQDCGAPEAAEALIEEALAFVGALDAKDTEDVAAEIAPALARCGRLDAALALADTLQEEDDYAEDRADTLRSIAVIVAEGGALPAAEDIARRIEDPDERGPALADIAALALAGGDHALAAALIERAFAASRDIREQRIRAEQLARLADLALRGGAEERAGAVLEELIAVARTVNIHASLYIAYAQSRISSAAGWARKKKAAPAQGDREHSPAQIREEVEAARRIGDRIERVKALVEAGQRLCEIGQPAQAAGLLREIPLPHFFHSLAREVMAAGADDEALEIIVRFTQGRVLTRQIYELRDDLELLLLFVPAYPELAGELRKSLLWALR